MKKVVIVGGGFTGTLCAKKLQKKFDVTLIDNKPYFEFTPGILRTLLEPEHCKKIQALHEDYLKKAEIVNDEVVEVNKKFVKTKNNNYDFDYLIIASGSSYSIPIKEPGLIPVTRAKELVEYNKKLKEARKILIVGGGLVGTELAAEICTHYQDKEISICHSKEELIDRNNKKARDYARKFLEKRNVKICFNEKANKKSEKNFETSKSNKFKPDIAFLCTGIKPNYKFMESKFSHALNKKNQIRVNEYLQVEDCNNIFCGGDITGISEEKTAQTSENHAKLIVKNLKKIENGKELIKYKSKRRPMVISLGKYDGIFEFKKFVFTGLIPGLMKSIIEWKTMLRYR